MPVSPYDPDPTFATEERRTEESREEFDRAEFAMSVLEVLRPPQLTVAVCRGRSQIRVQAGRAWGRGEGARWALVAIPPRASRESIVLALAELGATPRAYALDVLVSKALRPHPGDLG